MIGYIERKTNGQSQREKKDKRNKLTLDPEIGEFRMDFKIIE